MPSVTNTSGISFGLTNSTRQTFYIQLRARYGEPRSSVVTLEPQQTVTLVLASGSLYQYSLKHEYQVTDISVKIWHDYHWDIARLDEETDRSRSTSVEGSMFDGVRIDCRWQDYRQFLTEDQTSRSYFKLQGGHYP
ncbi:hypothetical protein CPB85DRAFT_1252257 [Mucidula mucida]|nr:hypothetical protein CPB85DRAFT_1252257 [Mucidula mucida]